MDFKLIQQFRHLAQTLHFGKTAEAMYVSPSTLSRSIQRLEEELGASLLLRDNRKVKLTPVGEKLLQFSDKLHQDWQVLMSDIQEHNEVLKGELGLFCTVTASMSHLPALLSSFREKYPEVEIKLATGNPGESAQKVLEGQTDVSIVIATPNFPEELHFQHLDTVPLVLVTPKHSNYSAIEEIEWHKIHMILPDSGPSKRIVHHWLAEKGIRPKVYASVGGNEAILSMVALGCGIAIVPEIVVQHATIKEQVKILPIADIEAYRLGLCCLKKRRDEPVIKAFLKH